MVADATTARRRRSARRVVGRGDSEARARRARSVRVIGRPREDAAAPAQAALEPFLGPWPWSGREPFEESGVRSFVGVLVLGNGENDATSPANADVRRGRGAPAARPERVGGARAGKVPNGFRGLDEALVRRALGSSEPRWLSRASRARDASAFRPPFPSGPPLPSPGIRDGSRPRRRRRAPRHPRGSPRVTETERAETADVPRTRPRARGKHATHAAAANARSLPPRARVNRRRDTVATFSSLDPQNDFARGATAGRDPPPDADIARRAKGTGRAAPEEKRGADGGRGNRPIPRFEPTAGSSRARGACATAAAQSADRRVDGRRARRRRAPIDTSARGASRDTRSHRRGTTARRRWIR